jgi:hypothetical protein
MPSLHLGFDLDMLILTTKQPHDCSRQRHNFNHRLIDQSVRPLVLHGILFGRPYHRDATAGWSWRSGWQIGGQVGLRAWRQGAACVRAGSVDGRAVKVVEQLLPRARLERPFPFRVLHASPLHWWPVCLSQRQRSRAVAPGSDPRRCFRLVPPSRNRIVHGKLSSYLRSQARHAAGWPDRRSRLLHRHPASKLLRHVRSLLQQTSVQTVWLASTQAVSGIACGAPPVM